MANKDDKTFLLIYFYCVRKDTETENFERNKLVTGKLFHLKT